jgi:phosphate starvation-inducible membrane PsiE
MGESRDRREEGNERRQGAHDGRRRLSSAARMEDASRRGGGQIVQIPQIFCRIDRTIARFIDPLGNLLVDLFHYGALFAIGAVTVYATVHEIAKVLMGGPAKIEDLLLLFIYLEIGAMVGIYFRTNRMPVRFLVYVAITALTRLLIGEAGKHEAGTATTSYADMMWIAGSTLVLAVALLLLRFGSAKFPSPPSDHESILRRLAQGAQEQNRRPRDTDSP